MTAALSRAAAAQRAGRTDEAARLLDVALEADPDDIAACQLASAIALQRGDPARAEALSRRALRARPDLAEAATILGHALLAQDAPDRAADAFRQALAGQPDAPTALDGLAGALRALGDLDAAIAAYRATLAASPDDARLHTNLAVCLQESGALDAARDHFDQAVSLQPDLAEARKNRGMFRLLIGDLGGGFDDYAWRWREAKDHNRPRDFGVPAWDGDQLGDQSLLIWGEQGIGDEIMFASLAPEVTVAARACAVECEPRLKPLFARSFPNATVIARGAAPAPGMTAQCAAGDLCRWLRRDVSDFPAPEPYLIANRARAQTLRATYCQAGRRVVGITWASATPYWGAVKSVPLNQWGPILTQPDTVFVSLQYGDRDAEIAAARERFGATILIDRSIDQMADLDGFAAQVAAMDAVVSVSGTTAHMAGALGVPSHVLLAAIPDWRWQLARPRSLWYPRQHLHRQAARGDWSVPIEAAATMLTQDDRCHD